LYYSDQYGNIPYPVALKYIKKFVWGKQPGMGTVQEFGWREKSNRMHWGLDFNIGSQSDDLGIELLSMADGVVIYSGWSSGGGNTIIIRHGNGYITRLFHMKDASLLKAGEKVNEGDVVGSIGNTGGKYAVHGHIEIAKIEDDSVTDDEALKLFKTYKFHLDPREIVGQGSQGDGHQDLQILSTKGKEVANMSTKENLSEKFPPVVQDNIRTVKPVVPEHGKPHSDAGYFFLKKIIEFRGAPSRSIKRNDTNKEKERHKSPRTF
jgi:murein DD-endopeptidase MepM/ murein hydrolase activator NlpD